MRFQCKNCKFPVRLPTGVLLVDAVCPKCKHELNLDQEDRMFGSYEMLEMLGSGGFGTVFKVRKPDSHALFTLKLIRRADVSKTEQVHLLRQIHSSRRIHHENVVAAHDFGQETDYWYLISDYVDGLPLNYWAKKVKPDPRASLQLCSRIGDVLEFIHQQQFVHRDLKPGNIIVDCNDQPHIIDFGLCKSEQDSDLMAIERYRAARQAFHYDKSAQKKLLLGTPGYAAPEQLSGDPFSANPGSDIYSLGVILYELLTGKRPSIGFGGFFRGMALRSSLKGSGFDSQSSKRLKKLCVDSFSANRAKRPASARAFAEACKSLLASPNQQQPSG